MAFLFALSLPGLGFLLLILFALERIGLQISRTSWLPWRRRKAGDTLPATAMAFDVFGAAIHDSKRMEMAQRQTESMMRADDAEGAPPRTTVDLDAGHATIYLPRRPDTRE
jgi:hypothetical protein